MAEKQKKDFVGRREIRTMKKDMAAAQEGETVKERERIFALEPEKEEKKKQEKYEFKKETPPKIEEKKEEPSLAPEEKEQKLAEEIEKKWEEEEKRRAQDRERRVLSRKEEKEKLREEAANIERLIGDIPAKRKPIEEKKQQLIAKKEEWKISLTPVIEEEKKAEEKKQEIEEREKKAITPEKRREIEQERWEVEKGREEIESRKWTVEEEIEKIEKEIEDAELKFREITKEEENLHKRKQKIQEREKELTLEEEKGELDREISGVVGEREPLDRKLAELSEKKKEIELNLVRILKEEKDIEEQIRIMEEREKSTIDLKEQREIEKQRVEVEKDRMEVEKERWNLEEEIKKINIHLKEVNLNRSRLLGKENRLKIRGKEIEKILKKVEKEEEGEESQPVIKEKTADTQKFREELGIGEERVPRETLGEEELIRKARERLEKLSFEERKPPEKKEIGEKPPLEPIPLREPKEEKVFERPFERFKERESFSIPQGPGAQAPSQIPPRSSQKTKSNLEKILPRVLIILVLVLLFGLIGSFAFNVFKKKEVEISQPSPQPEVTQPIPLPTSPPPQVLEPSPALFEVGETKTLEISQISEIPSVFESAFKGQLKSGDFTRILFQNKTENKFIELSEFFQVFQIKVPEEFFLNITKEHTLFFFNQPEGNRFGFIIKTENEEKLKEIAVAWEKTMEKDFENLLLVLGKKKSAPSPNFKSATRKGVPFRYLTFADQKEFGICYAINQKFFIWSSSCKSLITLIEKLF